MNSSNILSIVTFVYGFASVLYIVGWLFKARLVAKSATVVLITASVGNIVGIILRWIESYDLGIGHAPLSNMYESLVFFSATIAVIYLFVEFKFKNRVFGAFVSPVAFLAIAYVSFAPNITDKISPLIPALKSNWLIAHVFTCFLGYAGFAVAFGMSLMYLLKPKNKVGEYKKNDGVFQRLPSVQLIDELTYQMVAFGFLFLSIGIITGAVWANSAWGTYWSWDPKETWSLITWIIYAIFLHLRMMRGWHGTRLSIVSIIGFVAMLFTYFGVNLLPGLHSYG